MKQFVPKMAHDQFHRFPQTSSKKHLQGELSSRVKSFCRLLLVSTSHSNVQDPSQTFAESVTFAESQTLSVKLLLKLKSCRSSRRSERLAIGFWWSFASPEPLADVRIASSSHALCRKRGRWPRFRQRARVDERFFAGNPPNGRSSPKRQKDSQVSTVLWGIISPNLGPVWVNPRIALDKISQIGD
jgi:hypothetical protein